MSSSQHIENPDIVLIGSGVMSATLGAMLKSLDPKLKIQLYEVTEDLAQESSNGWNNAGTGHAGICELSYTPNRGANGEVDVSKAIEILSSLNSRNISGHMLFVIDLLIAQKNSLIRCLMFLLFMARNRLIFCVHDTTQ